MSECGGARENHDQVCSTNNTLQEIRLSLAKSQAAQSTPGVSMASEPLGQSRSRRQDNHLNLSTVSPRYKCKRHDSPNQMVNNHPHTSFSRWTVGSAAAHRAASSFFVRRRSSVNAIQLWWGPSCRPSNAVTLIKSLECGLEC